MYSRSLIVNLPYHFTIKFQHAFSCESSDYLPVWTQSHIDCICTPFLHCVFSYAPSKNWHKRMQSHTGGICLTFLHRVSSYVSSNCLHLRMHSHICCICLTFLHCVFSNVSSNCLHDWMHSHTGCIFCVFFSAVCYQMGPQSACMSRCKVTLVAFVWLFSTVHLQVSF